MLMDDRASKSIAEVCRVHTADLLAPMDRSVVASVMRCVREQDERRRRTRSLWLTFAPAFVTAAVLLVYTGTMLPSLGVMRAPTGDASIPRIAESAVPPDDSAFVAKGADVTAGMLTTTQAMPLLRIELGGNAVKRSILVAFLSRDYREAAATLTAGARGEDVFVSVDIRAYRQLRILAHVYGLHTATDTGLWLPSVDTSLAFELLSGDATGTAGLTICIVP